MGGAFAADSGNEESSFRRMVFGTDETGDDSLTTQFAANNNFAGNSFDLIAANDITVVGWDINLATYLPDYDINVYWKEGTADGFEQNAAVWNLLGSINVVPNGENIPTHVDLGGLEITAGDTIGVIIQSPEAVSGTGGFMYTNDGPYNYSNSDLEITTYRGLSAEWPPASVFTYRGWNGTVHYNYGLALDKETWASIKNVF
ncbi:MAG: hypothetical protein GF388_05390 [Candidatus Aegiribacteria sp.]|nr:hypothetical protein [Candidatus Aegiribacteria sp.]